MEENDEDSFIGFHEMGLDDRILKVRKRSLLRLKVKPIFVSDKMAKCSFHQPYFSTRINLLTRPPLCVYS